MDEDICGESVMSVGDCKLTNALLIVLSVDRAVLDVLAMLVMVVMVVMVEVTCCN